MNKEEKKQLKAELLKSWKNPYKVDDILYSSWGYDQTNIDFYQVVKVTPRGLRLREIGAEGVYDAQSMTGTASPVADDFIEEEFTARISFYLSQADNSLKSYIASKHLHGATNLCNGKPKDYSRYA